MNLVFKIYHTENCQKCKLTARKLRGAGRNVIEELIDSEKVVYMKSKGLSSAPLVQVLDSDGVLVDEWSNMNVTKISYWTKGE